MFLVFDIIKMKVLFQSKKRITCPIGTRHILVVIPKTKMVPRYYVPTRIVFTARGQDLHYIL